MPEPVELARATWPTVPDGALVLVPVGSTEQHGPHLPFHTDSVIAQAVARATAHRLPYENVVLAPTLMYGASGEHAGFPGTLSIGHEALRAVLVETVRSLSLWAGRAVFVNGHGGNVTTLDAACAQLRHERHDVAWLGCVPPGADAHAGRAETSVMLHLAPHDVRLAEAAPGDTRPLPELLPRLMAHGVRDVSPNGVLGDPAGASAREGRALVEAMVSTAVRLVTEGHADPRGRLTTAAPQGVA
ncbi:mycofactocin biosynthesis peptidyl-dipeptidase MftE [Streptomyces sp. BYX5S]